MLKTTNSTCWHVNRCLFLLVYIIVNVEVATSISLNMLSSGCTSYNCKRTCLSPEITQTPGDNGFKVIVEGSHERYVPQNTYKSKL